MKKPTLAERAKAARERMAEVDPKRFGDPGKAAAEIGCSRTLVVSWEDGTAKAIGGRYLLGAATAYRVDPEWLALRSDEDGYPFRGSQAVRIDVDTLRSATATLLRLCELYDLEFNPVEDADLVADFYARAFVDGGSISADNVIKLSDVMKRRSALLKEMRDETDGAGRTGTNAARKGRAQAKGKG